MVGLLRKVIYSFHMPAFIFMSGVIAKKTNEFGKFIKNRLFRLFIPALVGIVLVTIYNTIIQGKEFLLDVVSFDNLIKQILLMGSAKITYWFLGALFTVYILSFICHSFFDNIALVVSLFVLFLAKIVIVIFPSAYLWPVSIIQGMILFPFYEMGFWAKENGIFKINAMKMGGYSIIALAGMAISIVFNPFEYNISLWNAGIGEVQWYIIGGLSGTIAIVALAKIIANGNNIFLLKTFLMKCGNVSLNIYIFHRLVIDIIMHFFSDFYNSLGRFLDLGIIISCFLVTVVIIATYDGLFY